MTRPPLGRRFLTIWAGQSSSAIGSSVAGVGIAVHVFVTSGDAAALGWFLAIAAVPSVLTAPLIPAVDRFRRRTVMIAGDALAAVGPVGALTLASLDRLELWHLGVAAFVGGVGGTFQHAAAASSVPALVTPEALGRANGLDQAGPAAGIVIGPIVATPLVARWGVEAVLLVDVVTFAVAVATTLAVPFDDVVDPDAPDDDGSWAATRRWLAASGRPLVTVLVAMAVTNLALSLFNVSILVVATEVGGVASAGLVLTGGGVAMLAGSVVVGRRGVRDDRLGTVARGLAVVGAGLVVAAVRPVFALVVGGVALALSQVPRVTAAGSTIFHERVPPSMYARVFGLRAMVGRALDPFGAVVGGLAIAHLAEPAMDDGGTLAGSLGRLIGTGSGRGAALVLAVGGLGLVGIGVVLHRSGARPELAAGAPPARPATSGATGAAEARR